MSLRDDIKAILVNEGADNDGGWHSWRCFDKERYPEPCDCTDQVVDEIVKAIESPITAYRQVRPASHSEFCWCDKCLKAAGYVG